MGSQNIASYFSCPDVCRRKLGGLQEKDRLLIAHQIEENGSVDVGRKNRGQNLDDNELGYLRWRGSNHEGTPFGSGMENHYMVAEQEREKYGDGPD